ncbi:hypothetical protein CBI33_23325 [Rhodococcus erythropolis]|nr:hypothetical protein CBI33_23325 [Rhodococcus erythropolis]
MPPEHHGSVRVAERPGRCGNCAHPAPSLERGWIERCLRFAPQPARCAEILVMDTTPERWNSAVADIRSTGPDRAGSSRSAAEPSPSAPRLDSEITPESAQRTQERLEQLVELEDADDR